MAAVVRRPPERPLLVSGRRRKRYQELENSPGLVGAVREEAMKPGRDGEHPHDVKGQTRKDRHGARARPDDEQAGQMHEEELNADGAV
jgi:hypothetical protein